jgi:hypothetical protein
MPAQFVVDQAATFNAVVLLSCEPKLAFRSDTQDRSKDGTSKWEAQVVCGFRDSFGRTSNEVLKVGLASAGHPADGVPPFSPVQLVNFVVGVMEKRSKDGDITGVQTWYRCDELRPIAATGGRGKLEPVAS